jgi:hypothetical protein
MSQTALQPIEERDRAAIIRKVVMKGDLSDLTPEEQINYYMQRCERLGLDPSSRPFDFLETKDKETGKVKVTLYPNKECAAQLIRKESVSIYQLDETEENGVYRATAYARMPDGRTMINKSVAKVKGLEGKNYENAIKRCVTQAIRRTILMACGLGDTDESEIGDIPNARPLSFPDQEALTTPAESESLELRHQASGLDKWQCGRALAMQVIKVCEALEAAGCPEDIWREWLPARIGSRTDLTAEQAQKLVDDFGNRLEVIKQAEITKWNCSPTSAVRLIHVFSELISRGVERETIMQKLSKLAPSFRALSDAQATEALKELNHWLKSYDEATEGKVS